ncbi:Ribokinase-like protein [Boletus edulis BED1]|uniref:Ribokinase-like protein n=1 Tax=Boletus edulis BED1 TaxID=1328754 RepID=A0AAD4C6Z0_BOLED|nr:Ribokinase-like protein [Boletus edulis BED1]
MSSQPPFFVSIGLFIIDDIVFTDTHCDSVSSTIGGGGTYATIGARIWLPPARVGMIVDKGNDFPTDFHQKLLSYGRDVWLFREHTDRLTTRALNSYRGDIRNFEYLTPRLRLSPRDLRCTRLARPATLHFICSPTRALQVISEVDWNPTIIYEPIPDRCVPEELPTLRTAMASIDVLSPNAEEALALLSLSSPVTRDAVQSAALCFLDFGVGPSGKGCVIIRSAALGACVATRDTGCRWVDAFWTPQDTFHIVDVTGAGNSFLGGLAAGLILENGDMYQAALYASVSASFTIEQYGLPSLSVNSESGVEEWNEDSPRRRLEALRQRQSGQQG